MKKISIRTAQNILIDFQVAPLGHRILGFIVDLVIIAAITGILAILLLSIDRYFAYFLPIIFIFYTPVSEMLMNGRNLGQTHYENPCGERERKGANCSRFSDKMVFQAYRYLLHSRVACSDIY